jgi:Na+-transporting NADH:ubiquinone oxidoreductase subunit NqrC
VLPRLQGLFTSFQNGVYILFHIISLCFVWQKMLNASAMALLQTQFPASTEDEVKELMFAAGVRLEVLTILFRLSLICLLF